MKENRTDPSNISFINDVIAGQQGVDYNVTRAKEIAPFSTGMRQLGGALGLGTGLGPTKEQQQAAAQAMATDMGVPYQGQSLAEMIALDKNYRSSTLSPVDSTQAGANAQAALAQPVAGTQAPVTGSMGLGIPDELLSYPSGMNSMASVPTTGLRASEIAAGAGQFGVPAQYSYLNEFTGRPAQPVAVDSFTGPYTQPTLGTASEIVDRQMQAAGLTSAPSEQTGVSTSPTLEGVSQTGDYRSREVGKSTSPTLEGVSQIGNYGIEEGDFDTPDNQGANMDDDAPAASRDMSTREGRKSAADDEARDQTGNPNSSAVTDSSGNAVRSTDGSVVTNTPPSDNNNGGGGGGGCVIATHGVMTGGFTVMEKAKAELWCQKTYHGKWYGEAFRKGYKAAGLKHVNAGTAPSVYQEFKDFVAYGRGVKKGWKLGINYYWRTFSFFITGLFMK
jgi:hypothetical protein